MASAAQDDEPKGLTCSVCYDAPTQPVVTRCGHLMCWSCLTRWADHELSTGVAAGPKVPCPVCRGGVDPQDPQDVHPILGGAGERTPDWGPRRDGSSSSHPQPQQQTPQPHATPRAAPPAAARAPEPARGHGFNPFGAAGGGGARRGLGMGIPFFFMFGGFGGYETALLFLLPLGVILLQNYAANNAVPQPGHGGIVGAIRRFVGRAPDGSVVGLATIGIFLAFVYLLTTGDLTDSFGMEPSRVRHRSSSSSYRSPGKSAGGKKASRHDFGPQVTIV